MATSITETFARQFVFFCYAIGSIYWIVAAFWTKRTAERQGWTRMAALVLILLFVFRRMIGPMPPASHLWSYSPAIGVFASVVTAIGLVVLLWGRMILGGNWSADVALKEDHELIERGPYRYVRHPIYSGFLLMAIGGVLLWGTTTAVMVFVVLPVVLWFKLSQEERLLTKHFPDAYPRYKLRVKALVPFVV